MSVGSDNNCSPKTESDRTGVYLKKVIIPLEDLKEYYFLRSYIQGIYNIIQLLLVLNNPFPVQNEYNKIKSDMNHPVK